VVSGVKAATVLDAGGGDGVPRKLGGGRIERLSWGGKRGPPPALLGGGKTTTKTSCREIVLKNAGSAKRT